MSYFAHPSSFDRVLQIDGRLSWQKLTIKLAGCSADVWRSFHKVYVGSINQTASASVKAMA